MSSCSSKIASSEAYEQTLAAEEYEFKKKANKQLALARAQQAKYATFHSFPRLPVEVRAMIWKLAEPGPRLVELRPAAHSGYCQHDFVTTGFPASLHVSRESRAEILKTYELAFDNPKYAIPVYFNFRKDTLYIRTMPRKDNRRNTLKHMPDLEKVQTLAVEVNRLCGTWARPDPFILAFTNLKELMVLVPLHEIKRTSGKVVHLGDCPSQRHHLIEMEDIYIPGEVVSVLRPKYGATGEETVTRLLKGIQRKVWGELDWQVPNFKYGAICYEGMGTNEPVGSPGYYCPKLCITKPKAIVQSTNARVLAGGGLADEFQRRDLRGSVRLRRS